MRVVVVGAGVGGLAAGVRLARAGHSVVVAEQAAAPGGKCGRVERDGLVWDSGPSLVTMPWVFEDLLGPDRLELMRVEPVTRYGFADGTSFDMSADLPVAIEALEAWSPGAGADWTRFLGVCAGMWRASVPFLTGPPPWPPRRPGPGLPAPDPRDLLRIKPWHTLRTLARALIREPRLRLVVERFATYAGADPRRAPAALAVAGYVEHAWGAWHPRGGVYEVVRALGRALEEAGGELRLGTPVERIVREGRRAVGVDTPSGRVAADAVVSNADAASLRATRAEPSLSGLAIMAERAVHGLTPSGTVHHEIRFPADYDAEFDDIFVHRRPVRDPTLYESTSCVTDPTEAPPGRENLFVLVNQPAGLRGVDWNAEAHRHLNGVRPCTVHAIRSPEDLERETGAVGGAIYGTATHGRLGTLKRPGNRIPRLRNGWAVGGTVHPGGGLPLVLLSAATVAQEIGPA